MDQSSNANALVLIVAIATRDVAEFRSVRPMRLN